MGTVNRLPTDGDGEECLVYCHYVLWWGRWCCRCTCWLSLIRKTLCFAS
ncbi:hypothetical protein GBAR_LOCUS11588, partial [Geodia barretti]